MSGSSQRHTDGDDQQSSLGTQSERSLGGLLRRATSLRGLDGSSNSNSSQHRRQDLLVEKEDDGPSGVANFLKQIEPQPAAASGTTAAAPSPPEKQGGTFIRGLIKRASSMTQVATRREELTPTSPPQQQQKRKEADLQPVLVLTDGNHGKVVFANMEAIDPAFGSSELLAEKLPIVPDASNSTQQLNSSFHTARTSATTRDSTVMNDGDFYLDFSEREIGDSSTAVTVTTSSVEDNKGGAAAAAAMGDNSIPGRLRNLFQRTSVVHENDEDESCPAELTTTDDSSGECSQDPAVLLPEETSSAEERHQQPKQSPTPKPATPPTTEPPLPSLVEMEQEQEEEPHDDDDDEHDDDGEQDDVPSPAVMEALLEVVEQYEHYEKEGTCGSTSSDDGEESDQDLDVFEECPDGMMNDHLFVEDIEVEAQPPREYDELELFYEEQTFAHVGGSLLLGAQSELMTVMEYGEEEYDSQAEDDSDYDEDDYEEDESEDEFIDLNPDFDPSMHECSDSMLMLHSFLPAVQEGFEESCESSFQFEESFNSQNSSCSA